MFKIMSGHCQLRIHLSLPLLHGFVLKFSITWKKQHFFWCFKQLGFIQVVKIRTWDLLMITVLRNTYGFFNLGFKPYSTVTLLARLRG